MDRAGRYPPAHRVSGPALLFLCGLAAATSTPATTLLRSQDLPSLVAESRRAVLAGVASVRHGYDERGLHSTFVTLRVDDVLYGDGLPDPGGEVTIKLYGAPHPMPDGSRLFVEGTPRFQAGDRFLLLLLGESEWGFTSVAGLFQGAVRLIRGRDGVLRAPGLAGRAGEAPPYHVLREAVLSLRAGGGGGAPGAGGAAPRRVPPESDGAAERRP